MRDDMITKAMILLGVMAILALFGFGFLIEALTETIGKKATVWGAAACLLGAAAYIYPKFRKLVREIEENE